MSALSAMEWKLIVVFFASRSGVIGPRGRRRVEPMAAGFSRRVERYIKQLRVRDHQYLEIKICSNVLEHFSTLLLGVAQVHFMNVKEHRHLFDPLLSLLHKSHISLA